MLVERGAEKVVSFDILPQPPTAWQAGIGMDPFRWMETDGPCKNAGFLFGQIQHLGKHSVQYHLGNCGRFPNLGWLKFHQFLLKTYLFQWFLGFQRVSHVENRFFLGGWIVGPVLFPGMVWNEISKPKGHEPSTSIQYKVGPFCRSWNK